MFTKKDDRLLFTTFTRNLATDIQENLWKICSVEALSRMDVVNLDAWVSSFLRSHGYRHQVVFGEDENEAWAFALNLAPAELGLGRHSYRSEWEQVVQAQNITDEDQYVRASRLGRGTKLNRQARKKIWPKENLLLIEGDSRFVHAEEAHRGTLASVGTARHLAVAARPR